MKTAPNSSTWVTSGGLAPTLRRQVDPRQRTPPAARVASGSGHEPPLALQKIGRLSPQAAIGCPQSSYKG